MLVTVSERKKTEAERRSRAARTVADELRAFARSNGGRFVLFGSFASGAMRFDSDLDVLIDFDPDTRVEAWSVVERACARAAIEPDIHDASTSKRALIERAVATGLVLD